MEKEKKILSLQENVSVYLCCVANNGHSATSNHNILIINKCNFNNLNQNNIIIQAKIIKKIL